MKYGNSLSIWLNKKKTNYDNLLIKKTFLKKLLNNNIIWLCLIIFVFENIYLAHSSVFSLVLNLKSGFFSWCMA